MGRAQKVWEAAKANPAGLSFPDLQRLAEAAGFVLVRTRGDHHLYSRRGIPEIINIQPLRGKAKVYQVRQVLGLIEKYWLTIT